MHHEEAVEAIEAWDLDEVLPALERISTATRNGCWAVGWISYEASPAFDPKLIVADRMPDMPLLRFVIYRDAKSGLPARVSSPYKLTSFDPSVTAHDFTEQIQQVKQAIAGGETYQVNLTYPGKLHLEGDPWSWFRAKRLARPGPYPFYIEEPNQVILSSSPELFFHQRGYRITCRPMKGTAHPGGERQLRSSIKDQAENVMIVDMIRNDLGKVAEVGSVKTEKLFEVESYPSVVQMTSTIIASGPGDFVHWLKSLFPCASITGAPKKQTMSWIQKLERTPRGIYTGCIGWISPDQEAEFNVAIRTAVISKQTGEIRYHTGCGIVWDSEPVSEYAESLLKTKVLHRQGSPYSLIETMRIDETGQIPLLPLHLKRLLDSAARLGFETQPQPMRTAIKQQAQSWATSGKCRLLLHLDGTWEIHVEELPTSSIETFSVDPEQTDSKHPELLHKTTRRDVYVNARSRCPSVDETLLVNERGEFMEFTIGNLLIRKGDQWLTPPLHCGGLAGVQRASLLASHEVQEKVLTRTDLEDSDEIQLVNALRGRIPLKWVK